ncbi:MAG: MoaD/ThiS family protein [Candidatus Hodarchaeota archaeon]
MSEIPMSMSIEIRFRGPLATQAGMQSIRIEIGVGFNLRRALQQLIDTNDSVKRIWTDPERIDREALILRNEVDVGVTGGLETLLENDDKLVILPLVHGG